MVNSRQGREQGHCVRGSCWRVAREVIVKLLEAMLESVLLCRAEVQGWCKQTDALEQVQFRVARTSGLDDGMQPSVAHI